jgi:hypothetical protein
MTLSKKSAPSFSKRKLDQKSTALLNEAAKSIESGKYSLEVVEGRTDLNQLEKKLG